MKLFKYKDYVNQFNESKQSKEDIDSICKKLFIENYTINDDGTVDVDNTVRLVSRELERIPLRFGKVTGDFICGRNNLTTLEGCPKEVGGIFTCYGNRLKSLKGCPTEVGGSQFRARSFDCSNNQLTSLEGCPTEVGGRFDCSNNQLTSLEGGPKEVVGSFYCNDNQLTSLEGCPNRVDDDFVCYRNQLVDVKGFPLIIGGGLGITGNPVAEIFKLFPPDRWKEVPEYLNEYNVIRNGNKVILQALELVYDELGLEVPDEIEIKGYEII